MSLSILRTRPRPAATEPEDTYCYSVSYVESFKSRAIQSLRRVSLLKLVHWRLDFSTEDDPSRVRRGVRKSRFSEEQVAVLKESGAGVESGNYAGGKCSEGVLLSPTEEEV